MVYNQEQIIHSNYYYYYYWLYSHSVGPWSLFNSLILYTVDTDSLERGSAHHNTFT
jgi:hypothetical protein